MESILPVNYGVIIRTAGEGKRVAELDEELRGLKEHWESCVEKIKPKQSPILIATEINRATAIVRDMLNDSFNNVYVNNVKVATELKEYIASFAPELEKIVKYYNGNIPIFDQFNLTRQIKTGFGRIVSLKSGAYLVIEHTEALHVVDVNSGNRGKKENDQETNALGVNLSAAEEIFPKPLLFQLDFCVLFCCEHRSWQLHDEKQ
jgi:ribonuclease G